jgi:hypothetical protein
MTLCKINLFSHATYIKYRTSNIEILHYFVYLPYLPIGVPDYEAEIILFEPDPGNAGGGKNNMPDFSSID